MRPTATISSLAFATLFTACLSNGATGTATTRLRVECDGPATTLHLRDVPLGLVVRPAGANFAIAHDVGGLFAVRLVPRGGACSLDCDDDDTFFDACHAGRWSAEGTLLEPSTPDATEDLPHLAVHVDGICDQSTIRVDTAPNEVEVDPRERVWVP